MAELLRLNSAQIGLDTIGDVHIDPNDKITETNLVLDFSTSSLNSAIGSLNTSLDGKFVISMIGIEGSITSGTGSSKVITTEIAAASPTGTAGGSSSLAGVVTSSPNNKVQIRKTSDGQPVEQQAGGPDVYGRVTEATGVFTLSFYYDNAGVETAFTFPSDIGIDILFPESSALLDLPFNALVNGVSFVDGLPAAHNHTVSELTDLTVTAVELNDVATLSRLDDTATDAAGAALIGFEAVTTNFGTLATEIQGALEDLDTKAVFLARLDDTTVDASGATLVGVEASLTNFSGAEVQAALEDLDAKGVFLARLDDTTVDASGATLVGVEASLTNFSGVEVQAALEDLDSKAVFLARLDDTTNLASGAGLVGVDQTNFGTISGADVQAALDSIDNLIGSGVPTRVESDNLTAQVDDGDPAIFTVTQSEYIAGSLGVFVNGSKQIKGLQYNETTPASGIFTFIAGAEPSGTDKVEASYDYLP